MLGRGLRGDGLLRDELRALLRLLRLLFEGGDLPGRQLLLLAQLREVGRPLGPRLLQAGGGGRNGRADRPCAADLHGELALRPRDQPACRTRLLDHALGGPGSPADALQPLDRLVERRGAEEDGDRVRLVLLVEDPQLTAEAELRHGHRALGRAVAAPGGVLLPRERRRLRVDPREIAAGLLQPALERVQLDDRLA